MNSSPGHDTAMAPPRLHEGRATRAEAEAGNFRRSRLRALIQKVEVVENPQFTVAYEQWPVQHRTRVSVTTDNGECLVGESGGAKGDLSNPKSDTEISTKFRDEIRPRFGLMRAKEFIMKDAYSFDATDEGAMASYRRMYDAYTRIFNRCGLKNFPVEADTGVIGGNYSHEFMVPAETCENDVVYCDACGYAANIEKATSGVPATAARDAGPAPEKFATPGVVTIEALAKEPYKVPANRQIKTLIYLADSQPVIVLIRGDDQLNETKFMARTGAVEARPATPDEIFALLGAHPGSLGAVANVPAHVKVLADERLRGANDMTTGANEDGFHLKSVSLERDIRVTSWHDLRTVKEGEPCAKCAKPLKIQRAIEVGHVFKLGTKYSEKLNARSEERRVGKECRSRWSPYH